MPNWDRIRSPLKNAQSWLDGTCIWILFRNGLSGFPGNTPALIQVLTSLKLMAFGLLTENKDPNDYYQCKLEIYWDYLRFRLL